MAALLSYTIAGAELAIKPAFIPIFLLEETKLEI